MLDLERRPHSPVSAYSVLQDLLETRRAVRVFDGTPVPEEVVRKCLDLALLSPSSSNLQPWEFHWVRSPQFRPGLVHAFLGQSAALTASEIIVVVARTETWNIIRQKVYESLAAYGNAVSPKVLHYYSNVCRDVYNQGRFGWRGLMKRVVNAIVGRTRAIVRNPSSLSDMKIWAVKSTALACQSLMLAFQSAGYDTCPLEGFDAKRISSLLDLEKDAIVVMGLAVGKRSYNGISNPRVRLSRELFIKEH